MKAAQINTYGDVSVIEINEVEIPEITDKQVLIEVHAASINPFDTTIRSGAAKDSIPLELPITLGGDIAGIVQKIGADVTSLSSGDRVYGQANVVSKSSGAFAEYAAAASTQVTRVPEGLEFIEAASRPLVGASALQALTMHIELQPDQKLFINGGAGGIGSIAIQAAKHIGAYVATTATGEGIEFVKSLGADEVIDYQVEDFTQTLQNYDAVFDTVGGDDFNRTFQVLSEGGVAVSMVAEPDEALAAQHGIMAIKQTTHVTTEILEELNRLIETGAVTPQVDTVFPLEDVRAAFEARESGVVHGKVVLRIRE